MSAINEEELREIFGQFDSDNSGLIDAKELLNALKKVFPDKSEEEIHELAGTILNEADLNDDKKISWDEFKAAAQS